jgi:polyisoprenoid-binding protein YceI
MMGRRRVVTLVGTLALGFAAGMASAAATSWTVDNAQSRLVFVPNVSGGEFTGRFERYAASIVFDPADLDHSSLDVRVDLASARTGDGERDDALQGSDFFAVKRWPEARFQARSFQALGDGKYEARGTLALRDVQREVRVPFEFRPDRAHPGTARLLGTAVVRRLDYGVGQGEWHDTEWVANEVRIEFDLRLRAGR